MQTPPESDFFYLSSAPHAWDRESVKKSRVFNRGKIVNLARFLFFSRVRTLRADFNLKIYNIDSCHI